MVQPKKSTQPSGTQRKGAGLADIEGISSEPARTSSNKKPKTGVESPVAVRSPAAQVVTGTVKWEYIYAILGLVLGVVCIIGGLVLCLKGIVGGSSWTASLLGLSSEINDSPPGVVLFIVGIFIIVATRPKVRLKNIRL